MPAATAVIVAWTSPLGVDVSRTNCSPVGSAHALHSRVSGARAPRARRPRARRRSPLGAEASVTSASNASTRGDAAQVHLAELRAVGHDDGTRRARQHERLHRGLGQVHVGDPVRGVDAVAADEGEVDVHLAQHRGGERVDERVLQRAQRAARDDDAEARDLGLELEGDGQAVREDRRGRSRSARRRSARATCRVVVPTSRMTLCPLCTSEAACSPMRCFGSTDASSASSKLGSRSGRLGADAGCRGHRSPVDPRGFRPARSSASRSARAVTVVTPNARLSSATRTKPRSATSASASSRRRGASSCGFVGSASVIPAMISRERATLQYANAFVCKTKVAYRVRRERHDRGRCRDIRFRHRRAHRGAPDDARRRARAHLLRRRRHRPRRRPRGRLRARSTRGPPTAQMRQDPLSGEWVSIAAARQNRVVLPPANLDPLAPQSPGNPSEIPSNYDVAVFENRSPSFGPSLAEPEPPGALDVAARGRARAHPHLGRPLRGRLLQPRARGLVRHADRLARAHRDRGVGRIARPRCRHCPASSRCSRSRTAAGDRRDAAATRTARSTPTPT